MPIGNMFFDCSDADHSLIKISKFYSIVYYQARD
ncbi:PR domain zinc finger protein 1 [Armadillidium vulgare]|nr:PR domain zinc finger protein 1 [Armadillidium vulgare]